MANLTSNFDAAIVSKQWASRPDDERFVGLLPLLAQMESWKAEAKALVVANRDLRCVPVEDTEHTGLALEVKRHNLPTAIPTHWSFGQLCGLAKAPAGYLRSLPSEMAADCVNFGLQTRDVEEAGILLRQNGHLTATACTGPKYGRIWNRDVVKAMVKAFGDGLTGSFRVPGEFGAKVEITKRNTTIYASDRDMFICLVDEDNRIEIPGRRADRMGSFARGLIVWNSEVGAATFGVASFLFDFMCCNRIIWGGSHYQEIKFRHTPGAPHRFVEEVAPRLITYGEALSEQSGERDANLIKAAMTTKIGSGKSRDKKAEDVDRFLAQRFTGAQAKAIKLAHEEDEGRPIETIWDVAVGATAYARSIPYQDERVKVERAAGQIVESVA
jgi:hypothetical protein